ncbi:MAG: PfkB family carbohydrate kinase [Phototrophicaceae bacterium]
MSIVIGGSLSYDYLMKVEGLFQEVILPHQLSQLTVNLVSSDVQRSFGGSAGNVAYTLGLLEMQPIVISAVGHDFNPYADHLKLAGVELRHLLHFEDCLTAGYYAFVDHAENRIATFVKGATRNMDETSFRTVPSADWVLIVPSEISTMHKWVEECIADERPYFYDPSHQVWYMPPDQLQRGIHHSLGVFINQAEADCILERMGWTLEELCHQCPLLVVTHKEEGSVIYQREQVYHIPTVQPRTLQNGTGAGDAYRGGFLAGLMLGMPLDVAGRMGALSATYCVEQEGTQAYHFTRAEFTTRFRQSFTDVPFAPF